MTEIKRIKRGLSEKKFNRVLGDNMKVFDPELLARAQSAAKTIVGSEVGFGAGDSSAAAINERQETAKAIAKAEGLTLLGQGVYANVFAESGHAISVIQKSTRYKGLDVSREAVVSTKLHGLRAAAGHRNTLQQPVASDGELVITEIVPGIALDKLSLEELLSAERAPQFESSIFDIARVLAHLRIRSDPHGGNMILNLDDGRVRLIDFSGEYSGYDYRRHKNDLIKGARNARKDKGHKTTS